MTRHPDSYTGEAEPVYGDVHDADTLARALTGRRATYYLLHSLDSEDFERLDAEAARAFGKAAADAGVQHIAYQVISEASPTGSPRSCAASAR